MNFSVEMRNGGAPHLTQGARVDWSNNEESRVSSGSGAVSPSSFLETIVCATDFSAASTRAFAHALAIALLRRARLKILHLEDDHHGHRSGVPAVRATLERWGLLKPGSSQNAVVEEFGVRVTKIAIPSRGPASAVADYLDEAPADLLVVATEGREGAARWSYGTVAEAISRSSRTTTLYVPAEAERTIVALSDGNLTLTSMLIPVDHAPDASTAVEFAR